MRFSEIILEKDNEDEKESDVVERMKSDLIDYLTSLSATGARGKIPTKKIVKFMQGLGYDVNPVQVSDLLQGSAFSADSDSVDINQQDDEVGLRAKRDKNFDKKKVNAMAKDQINREIQK